MYGLIALLLVLALGFSCLVEALVPYEVLWSGRQADSGRDLLHALVNEGSSMAGVLLIPALTALSPWAGIWPTAWPLAMQWLLAIVVADAGITFVHWLSHRWPLLWRFHAVHHSVTRFYGFNGWLKHPLHQAIETVAGTAPLIVAGMPQEIPCLLAFAVAIQLLLQQSNFDMRIGTLRHLQALAPVHRFLHQAYA